MSEFLQVRHLKKNYHTLDGEIEAIKDISFQIDEGDFVAIVGPSGCGKSTLLSILANLVNHSDGDIIYHIPNPVIGYMFQEDALFEHFTIMENILLGLKIRGKVSEEDRNYVIKLLDKYNLLSFKDKYPKELSGGMKQRCALIRTLSIHPDILFLDEPFSSLDYHTRLRIGDDIHRMIKDEHKTTIMVTHDIGEAISMANKVIVLSKSPSVIKSIYNICLEKESIPTENRKDKNYQMYFDQIWKDLENV